MRVAVWVRVCDGAIGGGGGGWGVLHAGAASRSGPGIQPDAPHHSQASQLIPLPPSHRLWQGSRTPADAGGIMHPTPTPNPTPTPPHRQVHRGSGNAALRGLRAHGVRAFAIIPTATDPRMIMADSAATLEGEARRLGAAPPNLRAGWQRAGVRSAASAGMVWRSVAAGTHGYWALDASARIPGSNGSMVQQGGMVAIVDSGTTFVGLPHALHHAMMSAIDAVAPCVLPKDADPDREFAVCDCTGVPLHSLPTLAVEFPGADGQPAVTVAVRPRHYMQVRRSWLTSSCVPLLLPTDATTFGLHARAPGGAMVLGLPVFHAFTPLFAFGEAPDHSGSSDPAARIGFAPAIVDPAVEAGAWGALAHTTRGLWAAAAAPLQRVGADAFVVSARCVTWALALSAAAAALLIAAERTRPRARSRACSTHDAPASPSVVPPLACAP
jgi:hypothetical protein